MVKPLSYVIVIANKETGKNQIVAGGEAADLPYLPKYNDRIRVGDGKYIVKTVVWDLTSNIRQIQLHCDVTTKNDKFLA
jgi:hypothetical protein